MCIGCVFRLEFASFALSSNLTERCVRSVVLFFTIITGTWYWCCCGCFFFSNFKIFALLLCILHSCGDFLAFWIMHLTSSTIDRENYNYRKPHVDSIICVSMLGYRFRITKNGNQTISRIMMCTEQ